ncbi:MAG: hypothetical protein COA57_05540 [Flavobacteriales bacterium]|nr:hypothetical protein [Bacteroidales bacterium AH-315-I05]PCJ86777.1 MAG: hypothetical protein COA57_05540 [Flavobacteriales bacterium]
MTICRKYEFFFLAVFLNSSFAFSQILDKITAGEIHGNFQTDVQYYNEDTIIGAAAVPEKMLMNGFSNIIYSNKSFSAGIRYESYLNALQGFPEGYRGNGIPYRFATFSNEKLTITVGNYYDQFGSGLIFRSYEERGLGYDNAMDGIRISYQIYKGVNIKGIVGKQRRYFDYGEGIVRGADLELNVNEIFDSLANAKTRVILGGSFVSKYQIDQNSQYNLPENVGAFAGRLNVIRGRFNLYGEYAYKINDPSADNGYIYKPGEGLLLQGSYSQRGLGISLAVKRIDNMSFRSDRDAALMELQINYLPAFTRQHTYNLLATLYPYATQPNGEMAFQGELIYKLKKGSPLGGKYGTGILINYSMANNIDTILLNDETNDRMGYKSDFLKFGDDVYFRDFNVEISKKFNKKLKGIFTYANVAYNKDVIEGKVDYGIVYADLGVADITYKIAKKHAIRGEIQGLFTDQDQGDWATVILEYTRSPHWFFAVMDQYNYGNPKAEKRVHYYYASFGYTRNASRIMLSYGRQRAGIFCVGGVCRNVPASNGITLTVTSTF